MLLVDSLSLDSSCNKYCDLIGQEQVSYFPYTLTYIKTCKKLLPMGRIVARQQFICQAYGSFGLLNHVETCLTIMFICLLYITCCQNTLIF